MKPARVLTVKSTLIAVLALLAVGGCNVILGNESRELDESSGGTAGTAMGGTFGEAITAGDGPGGGGQAGDEQEGDEQAGAGQGDGQAGTGQGGASNGGSGGAPLAGAPQGTGGEISGTGGQTQPPPTPLAAPTGVKFTPNSETEATITWQAVSEATTYTIEIATDTGFVNNRVSASATATTTKFSGLKADTVYQVRVRANGSSDRMSAWSGASGTTLLNPPTALSLTVFVSPQGTTVGYSGHVWIEPPDDLNSNGGAGQKWHYARGTASAKCAAGTTVQYRFNANYDSDGIKKWTPLGPTNEAYIVRPTGRITFYVQASCLGPNHTSAVSESSACRKYDNTAC